MTRNFDDLAKQAKARWSDDGHRVYEAASTMFSKEMHERASSQTPYGESLESQRIMPNSQDRTHPL